MKKIYVVIQGEGSYSDRSETPICAFLNKSDADLFENEICSLEIKLNDYYKKIYSRVHSESEKFKRKSIQERIGLIVEIVNSIVDDERIKNLIVDKINSTYEESLSLWREEKDYCVCEVDLEDNPDVFYNYFKKSI